MTSVPATMPLSWDFTACWFASFGVADRRQTERRRNSAGRVWCDMLMARRAGFGLKRNLYTAVVEHEAAPTVTVIVEPAGVSKRRIVTDPELSVSLVQLCPPSEAVASVPGWFEVT